MPKEAVDWIKSKQAESYNEWDEVSSYVVDHFWILRRDEWAKV